MSLTDNSTNWRYDINGAGKVSAADVNIIRSQPLAAVAAFPEPNLPGSSGGAVPAVANNPSDSIAVTAGTAIVNSPSAVPAGASLTVGTGGTLVSGSALKAASAVAVSVWKEHSAVGPQPSAADVAWLAQTDGHGYVVPADNSDQQPKRIAAIQALDALFAQYGR